MLRSVLHSFRNRRGLALTFFLGAAGVGLTACHSSSPPGTANNGEIPSETGAVTKIVPIAGSPGTVVALFPDGNAFYSPDGFNLGGGGSTVLVSGGQQVADVVAVGSGVDALLANGAVFYSPDGKNLAGGGATVNAYEGMLQVSSLTPVGNGVDAIFTNGNAYYSADGLNLGGGRNSVRIYAGGDQVQQIVAVGPGDAVVTLFASGTAFYSPNNRDIGGGSSTVSAAAGAHAAVTRLVKVGGGVLATFANGEVFLSPDGENLAGGGATISVAAWDTSPGNGPFPARDSAHGATFLGRLWFSGGFADPTYSNSCYWSCSFFDLWSSTDSQGISWNASPSFSTATRPDPRDAQPGVNGGVQDVPLPTDFYDSYSALTVWNGQLTALGSTVWRTVDGTTWLRNNLADGTAAPGPLGGLTRASENSRALPLGATLFFLQPDLGDVFSSTDPNAANWSYIGEMTSSGYAPRCAEAAFVLLGKLWVMGGGACDYSKVYNDIWSSPDGINWTRSPNPVAWAPRMWPCIAIGTDGIVWLAGGYAPTDWNNAGGTIKVRYGANHSDVWYSRDAVTWKQLKADLGSGLPDDGKLEPRHAPTCYITPDASGTGASLVIIAGTGGSDPNDANAETINSIRTLRLPAAAELP